MIPILFLIQYIIIPAIFISQIIISGLGAMFFIPLFLGSLIFFWLLLSIAIGIKRQYFLLLINIIWLANWWFITVGLDKVFLTIYLILTLLFGMTLMLKSKLFHNLKT